MVKHCSTNGEAIMGSNPVGVTKVFSGLFAIPSIAITTAIIISSFKFFPLKRVEFNGLKVVMLMLPFTTVV